MLRSPVVQTCLNGIDNLSVEKAFFGLKVPVGGRVQTPGFFHLGDHHGHGRSGFIPYELGDHGEGRQNAVLGVGFAEFREVIVVPIGHEESAENG